jgi:hypothetical protein
MFRKKLDQRGQALIELIIFLPLIFTLYGLIGGFANAINGSINQQKITRSYFYFRAQNSSNLVGPQIINLGEGLECFLLGGVINPSMRAVLSHTLLATKSAFLFKELLQTAVKLLIQMPQHSLFV